MSGVRLLQVYMLVSYKGGIQDDVINAALHAAESVQCKHVVISACTFCRTQRGVQCGCAIMLR
jgi:sulfur relay (sulfurtransferase) complex TusBCD TusD component (DsrE family)